MGLREERMSDTVKNTATVEPSGGGGGVEGATIAVKSTDTGDVLNSATSGSDGTTESLPPATLDNGLPGATN
jgi:tripartite-type tricarboxylate transporter receptor subunit TctC